MKNRIPKSLALAALAINLALPNPALSETRWAITPLDPADYPAEIVPDTRELAGAGLVDGRIATHEGGDIIRAWYSRPTERYRHAILGDGVEAGQLNVITANSRTLEKRLIKIEVFEDQTPRLADLDGDGSVEVITIRSSMAQGASMTIYGLQGRRLVEKASTGFYGRPNRWLNIAGIGAFTGGKYKEIAIVTTPHIGGTLFFYRYDGGRLTKLSAATGFSNHEIGSREMRLSAMRDINSDGGIDLAVPSDDRKSLRIMGFSGRNLKALAVAKLPAAIDKAIGLAKGEKDGFIVGLDNGGIYKVHP